MNASLKIVLFKGKKHSDGTHPIQLHLHVRGEAPQRKGIYKCLESDWDKKNLRLKAKVNNSAYLNNMLSDEYSRYEKKLIRVINGEITHANFFFEPKESITLDDVFELELARYKSENKTGSFIRATSLRNEFLLFNSSKTKIESINLKWYERLSVFLHNELFVKGKLVKEKNIGSTVQAKIKLIRRMIAKYSKIAQTDDVKNFKVKKVQPVKVKLTKAELKAIEELQLPEGSKIAAARDLFMLQIYLRGSRIGALVQAKSEQFDNGRYEPLNIAGSKNVVGCKLIDKAQLIVDKYYGKHDRLFPFFKLNIDPKWDEFDLRYKIMKQKECATAKVNRYIKLIAKQAEIDKNFSSHTARHTFARMAIDKVSNPMLSMELLGHKSLAVHQAYLNDIRKDDVLDAVADEIFS